MLREDATPFALSTPRRVSIPLLPVVEAELKKMEGLWVIRRVESPTDWCAGMVVVDRGQAQGHPFVSGGGSKCDAQGAYLCGLDAVERERERHDMPSVDQTLGRLAGAKVFTKLDANSGFWQIPLAQASQELTTFITSFGRYCFRRLPFGITSALEHF